MFDPQTKPFDWLDVFLFSPYTAVESLVIQEQGCVCHYALGALTMAMLLLTITPK